MVWCAALTVSDKDDFVGLIAQAVEIFKARAVAVAFEAWRSKSCKGPEQRPSQQHDRVEGIVVTVESLRGNLGFHANIIRSGKKARVTAFVRQPPYMSGRFTGFLEKAAKAP